MQAVGCGAFGLRVEVGTTVGIKDAVGISKGSKDNSTQSLYSQPVVPSDAWTSSQRPDGFLAITVSFSPLEYMA